MKFILAILAVALYQVESKPVNCTGACQQEDLAARMPFVMKLKIAEHKRCVAEGKCPTVAPPLRNVPCVDGKADEYECSNVDLLAFVPLSELGSSGDGNDIWGWTDPETGREYAIVGCEDGTSFVDVTEPTNPQVLGFLHTHTSRSLWRDLKVYANHVFIGSEASNHGLQVYDLRQLRDLRPSSSGVNDLEETAHYAEFGSSHNIVLNEDTGFVYSVGSRTCTSGLHVVDVHDPINPKFAGCFGSDGYTHDAQCVIYKGPDRKYEGREICFNYNENTLTIVDVEDKGDMKILSRVPYDNNYYTHQGWLTEDQSHLLMDDELDELYGPKKETRTLIWNVKELENPQLVDSFFSSRLASDHNQYIKGKFSYQANYCAGLRVLDITNIEAGKLEEVGFFDVAPDCDSPGFQGAWSNYPYFESGTIIVSSIQRGLFILKYTG